MTTILWPIKDGSAIRPSDGQPFSVAATRTRAGTSLFEMLLDRHGNGDWAIKETAQRVRVRITHAWGVPDDDRPAGTVEVSVDDGPWTVDGSNQGYTLLPM